MLTAEKFYNGEVKVKYLNTIPHKDTINLTAYPFMTYLTYAQKI